MFKGKIVAIVIKGKPPYEEWSERARCARIPVADGVTLAAGGGITKAAEAAANHKSPANKPGQAKTV